jgi:hypothetical protein
MDTRKKRFVILVPAVLILFASLLAAQGPPNCNVCWQNYTSEVKACHGDAKCLAAARAEARLCVQSCIAPR